MKIAAHDYASSLPNTEVKIKGGTMRFSHELADYVTSHQHQWVGLIHTRESDEVHWKELASEPKKQFFAINAPRASFETIKQLNDNQHPDKFFESEILLAGSLFNQIKPDLLFLNGFVAYSSILHAAAHSQGIPIAFKHSGILAREVAMYRDLYTSAALDFFKFAEAKAVSQANINIFSNEQSKKALEESLNVPVIENYVIIPTPVPNLGQFNDFELETKPIRVIGAVARWDRIKNHPAILDLAKKIQQKNLPWRVKVVTEIPETNINTEFKNQYRNIIEVIPPMERGKLADFYRAVDVLVLPSHFDVAPTVVMEALMFGKPTLISPKVGWVDEYQKYGLNNWIVDFSNPENAIGVIARHFDQPNWEPFRAFAHHLEKWHNGPVVYEEFLKTFAGLVN